MAEKDSIALNLGTGRGHSVREVTAAVERVTGRPVPVREAARRPGDPPALVANAAKAGRILRWKPQHSSLERIVETAWRWRQARAAAASLADAVSADGETPGTEARA